MALQQTGQTLFSHLTYKAPTVSTATLLEVSGKLYIRTANHTYAKKY